MKLEQYVPLAIRTEKPLPRFERLTHGCMGLVTEIGEVVTELKRMAIYGKPLDNDRKKHIGEEIGDVMWYVAIVLDALGTDIPYLVAAPRMELTDLGVSPYMDISLQLGANCGGLCAMVHFSKGQEADEEDLSFMLAALCMVINCVSLLAVLCDSTLGQAMDDNIAKLRIRYADKFSNEAAEARADKNGVDARNS